jgi:hypothetical protein
MYRELFRRRLAKLIFIQIWNLRGISKTQPPDGCSDAVVEESFSW